MMIKSQFIWNYRSIEEAWEIPELVLLQYLNVDEVPGHRAQHLKLGALDVQAEVVHLGVAQRQQQAEEKTKF